VEMCIVMSRVLWLMAEPLPGSGRTGSESRFEQEPGWYKNV
jgi:hypothetical protein